MVKLNNQKDLTVNRNLMRQLHLWLSIPFGLIIVVLCLSGAILLFERDYGHIGQAEVDPAGRTPISIDSIMKEVESTLPEGKYITGVTIYPDPGHAYKVSVNKPVMAALWVDQYTGKVIGEYKRAAIFKIASSAHRRLFGNSKTQGASGINAGKLVVGISAIVMLAIIVTGFILWWPMRGKFLHQLKLSRGKKSFKLWYDLHCTTGAISALIFSLCILTGLTWSFGWYKKTFYGVLGSEVATFSRNSLQAENFMAWDVAVSELLESDIYKEIRIYQGRIDVMNGGYGNQQASDTYLYDKDNGIITDKIAYSEKPRAEKIKGWIYTLHFGSWAGHASRNLYLCIMLFGVFLPISGYYLWIKRLRRNNR